MQSIVPLHGFGGVPYSAVRKAAPKNLLDNSDFANLVAQAGIGGNHGTTAYAADRWILESGTVSYEAGVGLTLNGTIRQKLEFPPTGDTSTFVGMASGEASISYADGAVTITSSGGVLKWAALYAGVYTDATMPDYHPKGYGAELAECQRYYRKMDFPENNEAIFFMNARNETSLVYLLDVSGMRVINPTTTISITAKALMGSKTIDPVTIEVSSYYPGLARLTARASGCTSGAVYMIVTTATDNFIDISADL